MASFPANPQIHEYSVSMQAFRIISLFILLIAPLFVRAQQAKLSTSNKKAADLYYKAEDYYKARNLEKAVQSLAEATTRDTTFGEAFLKLAGLQKVAGNSKASFQNYKKGLRLLPYTPALNQEYYGFALLNLDAGNYRAARQYFEKFLQGAPTKTSKAVKYAEAQIKNIAYAEEAMKNPVPFNPTRLENPLNNFPLQYFPALTADQRIILFTARAGLGGESDENLLVSMRQENSWTPPVSISPNINSRFNEGAGSISGDGKTLVFTSCDRPDSFGSCDLYISYRSGNNWIKPINLGSDVNSAAWESQPSLSADGRTLYFASARPGGVGKEDIWVTTLSEDNKWNKPINLGKTVNTPGNENTPFIHTSGSTLYYASDGLAGMGGTDIFKTNINSKGEWEVPQNMGYPLNTFQNETSVFISIDNKTGYYTRQGATDNGAVSMELYQFAVPAAWKSKDKSTYAQGTVFDAKTKKPLGANVQIYDVSTSKLVQQVISDTRSGDYTVVLTEGKQYAMYVTANNYLLKSLSFDYSAQQEFNPLTLDVYLDPISSGANIVLNNLFFETNKYALESKSKTELNKLIQFLNLNKEIKIEISGHTDDVGDTKANVELSKKRAQSVIDYLGQNAIRKERVLAIGYGESKPVKPNTSAENRQFNRRIELKIL